MATILDRNDGAEVYTLTLDDRIAPPYSLAPPPYLVEDDVWVVQLGSVMERMITTLPHYSYNTHDEATAYRIILREAARDENTFALFSRLLLRRKKTLADLDHLFEERLTLSRPGDAHIVHIVRVLLHHGACSLPDTFERSIRKACYSSNEAVVSCLLERQTTQQMFVDTHKYRMLSEMALYTSKRHQFTMTRLFLAHGAHFDPIILVRCMKSTPHRDDDVSAILKVMRDRGRKGDLLSGVDEKVMNNEKSFELNMGDVQLFETHGFVDTLVNPALLRFILLANVIANKLQFIELLVDALPRDRVDDVLLEACRMDGTMIDVVRLLTDRDRGARVHQRPRRDFEFGPSVKRGKFKGGDDLLDMGRTGDAVIVAVITSNHARFDKVEVLRHLLSLGQVPVLRLCDLQKAWYSFCVTNTDSLLEIRCASEIFGLLARASCVHDVNRATDGDGDGDGDRGVRDSRTPLLFSGSTPILQPISIRSWTRVVQYFRGSS